MARIAVIALARGYYGGQVREPGDRFFIKRDREFGTWMDEIDPEEITGTADQDVDLDLDDDDDDPKTGGDPKVDLTKAITFQGVKTEYGPEGAKISIDEALAKALSDFGHPVEKWNELDQKDRKGRIHGAVKDLVNAKQANAATE